MIEALLATNSAVAAIANPYALFAGGTTNFSSYTSTTEKYDYATAARTAGTVMSVARERMGAAGNYNVGVISGGDSPPVKNTDIYTYSDGTRATGVALAANNVDQAGTSTASLGYFFGGSVSGTQVQKYSYSGNVYTTGTALSVIKAFPTACGNSVKGIIAYTTATSTYTYSGEVNGVGGALSTARTYSAASGNTAIGLFSAGTNGGGATILTTNLYTYSSNAVTGGNNMGVARKLQAAAGNSALAIFAGGVDAGSTIIGNTEKYTFSGNAVVTGTALSLIRAIGRGLTASPGGF